MSVPENTSSALWYISHWAFVPILIRLGLALAIGLFIGLEREHSGKNGVRTFALSALLGCLGGLMGTLFSAFALGFIAIHDRLAELAGDGTAQAAGHDNIDGR